MSKQPEEVPETDVTAVVKFGAIVHTCKKTNQTDGQLTIIQPWNVCWDYKLNWTEWIKMNCRLKLRLTIIQESDSKITEIQTTKFRNTKPKRAKKVANMWLAECRPNWRSGDTTELWTAFIARALGAKYSMQKLRLTRNQALASYKTEHAHMGESMTTTKTRGRLGQ